MRRRAPRHRSREAALQVLFAIDLAERGGEELPAQVAFERVGEHFELPEGAKAFAKELVTGVMAHRAELDALIAAHSTRWRIERMAVVDRNILRLAAFEMRHAGTPAPVAIDEALRLAHRFGDDRSPGFVNGVLDPLAKAPGSEPA